MAATLRKRKPIVYISMAMYALLSSFIIVESCLGSGISGAQSNFFATISAAIVNFIEGPQTIESIKPNDIKLVSDSSYLGKGEDGITSQIAIGTTTLLRLEATYPEKDSKNVYDKTYEVIKKEGSGEDYSLVVSSSTSGGHFYIDVRVVANAQSSPFYSIDVKVADSITFTCPFNIVPLPAPTSYEMKLDKQILKKGESAQIDVQFKDEKQQDYYLRRYFDQSKLDHSSSNPLVATIDEYGVIRGLTQGEATITYGNQSFDIVVNDENIAKPVSNELKLEISNADNLPSLLDYDYVFAEGEDPNAYSSLIYASFDDDALEDQSVTWYTSDPLSVKLAPYAYDEAGYPLYHDENGIPCIRACGYRTNNKTTITCVSNVDSTLRAELELDVEEAKATSMKLNVTTPSITMEAGAQKAITATIAPKNTYNRAISATSSDPSVVTIKNNGTTSLALVASKEGAAHIVVSSLSNPSLTSEFDVVVKAKQAIDDKNYTEFHQSVRKSLGHFLLFAATAAFGAIFFFTFFVTPKQRFAIGLPISIGSGFMLAGVSEWIQFYIPSRSGLWSDVLIDFSGYLAGTIVCILVFLLIWFIADRTRRSKQKDNKEE